MSTRKLIAIHESKSTGLCEFVGKLTPLGRPFCIDIGCPSDIFPMYHAAFGKETLIAEQVNRCKLPLGANAYTYSSRGMSLEGSAESNPLYYSKREHHIVAIQCYKLE